jgi:serpin B
MNSKLFIIILYGICFVFLLSIFVPVSAIADDLNYNNLSLADSKQNSKLHTIGQLKIQAIAPINPVFESAQQRLMPIPKTTPVSSPVVQTRSNISHYSYEKVLSKRTAMEEAMNSLQDQAGKPDAASLSENAKEVVQANNQFALDFYHELVSNPESAGDNIFFSPWSISSVFALTYEGARGTTANEIRSVFHFPATDATLRDGYSELTTGLNNGRSGYMLYTANALWAEKTYPFLTDYISIADRYYSAKTTNLDFINKPDDSRLIINRWVEDRTRNRIKDLLPSGAIHSETRLVITNAIYFKGKWVEQFSKTNTIDEDFQVSPSQTVRVPMMKRTDEDAKYWYAETEDVQVLGMPYVHKSGDEMSMLVLLPKGNNLEALETSLSARRVGELNQALVYKRVYVSFPRFRLETDYQLSGPLADMGMPSAFAGSDFSGMDGTKNLFIDEVYHKAFVEVNEEGTEAAAATGATIAMGAEIFIEPIPVFRADHPFLFLIQDNDTGNILFIGRVVNPAG